MEPEPLQQIDRTYVRHKGGRLSYFAGCDYFRLASHPAMQQAIVEGLRLYGANVAASRLTTGNHILYREVETGLRRFFGAEAALVVSNGYATNLVAAQALAGEFTRALIDARAHVSLKDASQMLGCTVEEFAHRNAAALARAVKAAGRKGRLILLTDGIFSHDGAIAPLAKYLEVLPNNALVLLDDAHGAGVLGKRGRGTVEFEGVARERVIQTMTLSKAFGCYGGGVLCSAEWRERMVSKSRMFAGSTPPPLPFMNAAKTALGLLGARSDFRARLAANVTQIKMGLRAAGLKLPETPSPIVSYVPKNSAVTERTRKALLARQVFPSFIKYPGGPASGYFRMVISSEHTAEQLEALIEALAGGHD